MTAKANVVGGGIINPTTNKLTPVIADTGPQGLSAYQMWRAAGNNGSEEHYQESLKSTIAGENGWTPVFAGELDGTRTLIKVVDWVGGTGSKPSTGLYIGVSGYVTGKEQGFNFNVLKRVIPMSAVTNSSGIATIDYSSYKFTGVPVIVTLPATTTLLSGATRSVVVATPAASAPTKDRALVKVDQAALLTGAITLLVGATANVLVIEN